MLLFIIGGVVVIILAIYMTIASQDQSVPLQARLSARLTTLGTMVAVGEKNAKNPDLRQMNSTIATQVLSDTTSIAAELKKAGLSRPDKTVTTAEADTASFTTLTDAALNNNFDSTYKKMIAQKLDSTNALIKELYDKTTTHKSLKPVLNEAYGHFKLLQSQLAATSL
jgi:hypothetical protein